jgi:hypothetical protein
MRLTNAEVYNTKDAFRQLIGMRFPVLVSYALAQTTEKLNPHITAIEKVREQLILTYGTEDKDNPTQKSIKPGDENFPQFAQEFSDLMNQEIDVDVEVVELPLKVTNICSQCKQATTKDLEIEPYILAVLGKFIKIAEYPSLVRR